MDGDETGKALKAGVGALDFIVGPVGSHWKVLSSRAVIRFLKRSLRLLCEKLLKSAYHDKNFKNSITHHSRISFLKLRGSLKFLCKKWQVKCHIQLILLNPWVIQGQSRENVVFSYIFPHARHLNFEFNKNHEQRNFKILRTKATKANEQNIKEIVWGPVSRVGHGWQGLWVVVCRKSQHFSVAFEINGAGPNT